MCVSGGGGGEGGGDVGGVCSLNENLTHLGSTTWLTLSSIGAIAGGVLRILNQNRHRWTPPK